MVELADTSDSKSDAFTGVGVRFPPWAPFIIRKTSRQSSLEAFYILKLIYYLIGSLVFIFSIATKLTTTYIKNKSNTYIGNNILLNSNL